MQILITHGRMARSRVRHVSQVQLVAFLCGLVCVMMLVSAALYHFVFLKAVHEGWPVAGGIRQLAVHDERAQRDRFLRENLDAMARKLGEMQAKLVRLEAMGERVSGLAGVKPQELMPLKPASGAQGGPYIAAQRPSLEQLSTAADHLDEVADQHLDLLTLVESRLFENRLMALMIPSSRPVEAPLASGFGFRSDPFSGRPALHTGLDFAAEAGTPIRAAAGGVVITADSHPQYGMMVEIDHGNGLATRYAHASKLVARRGDLVKRGQVVAHVGSTGRSTGPHLHFEVLLDGVQQNPARFLAGKAAPAAR